MPPGDGTQLLRTLAPMGDRKSQNKRMGDACSSAHNLVTTLKKSVCVSKPQKALGGPQNFSYGCVLPSLHGDECFETVRVQEGTVYLTLSLLHPQSLTHLSHTPLLSLPHPINTQLVTLT